MFVREDEGRRSEGGGILPLCHTAPGGYHQDQALTVLDPHFRELLSKSGVRRVEEDAAEVDASSRAVQGSYRGPLRLREKGRLVEAWPAGIAFILIISASGCGIFGPEGLSR